MTVPQAPRPQDPRPQVANRPKEVDTSFWLWIANFVLGILGIFVAYRQIETIREQTIRQALAENPSMDPELLNNITTAAFGVGLVLGLIFLVIEVVFVFLMRGGRNWARIVMAVLGGIAVLLGLIGLASASGLSLVIALLQIALLIGAIVFMFRPAANAWFRPSQPGL